MVIVFPLLRTICTILIFNSILAVHTLRLCFQGTYNTGDLVKINEDKEQHIGIIQKVIKDAAGRSHHTVILAITVICLATSYPISLSCCKF